MPAKNVTAKSATLRALLGAAALLAVSGVDAEARMYHRRATSIYGARPAYWGFERPAAAGRDLVGRRTLRLRRSDASVSQLNPRLRSNDGRLAEHLLQYESPPPCFGCGLFLLQSAPPLLYWPGYPHFRPFLRRGR